MTRLATARLVLRPHAISDEALYCAFWAAAVRPIEGVTSIAPLDPELAFARLLRFIGHWSVFGFGPFVVEELATGRIVGRWALPICAAATVPISTGCPRQCGRSTDN